MDTTRTFDETRGDELKRKGMERAADRRADKLELARSVAKKIALSRVSKRCTADMVGRELQRHHGIETLGPAAGSLFKTKDWKFTGDFVQSKRVSNHSRLLRVWEYVGQGS